MSSLFPSEIVINNAVRIPLSELKFSTSRSSGPGGQNVNKLETRVQLEFDIARSRGLNDGQKQLLKSKLSSRVTGSGTLVITSQESRSQWINRNNAVEKFIALLKKALKPVPVRKSTKPSGSARERRLRRKKFHSETKRMRRRPEE